MFARDPAPNDISNPHQTRGNADPTLERLPVGTLQLLATVDDRERGINRTLRCIFLGLRIAEVGEHTVAHEFGDETVEPSDCPRAYILIAPDQCKIGRAHV